MPVVPHFTLGMYSYMYSNFICTLSNPILIFLNDLWNQQFIVKINSVADDIPQFSIDINSLWEFVSNDKITIKTVLR